MTRNWTKAAMLLPIADLAHVRTTASRLIRRHWRGLVGVLLLHLVAALCGLVAPRAVGILIDALTRGTATSAGVDLFVAVVGGAVVAQALLIRFAQRQSMVLGETVFARLREEFLGAVSRLPLSTVEQAGTGDLLSRTTHDIESVARTVRFGVPRVLVVSITSVLIFAAGIATHPLLALAMFAGVPLLLVSTRWYLRRSGPAYQRQLASYARLSGSVSETVEGAATIDALSLAPAQRAKIDASLHERRESERGTLRLRMVWFPSADFSFLLPVIVVVAWGALLLGSGDATIGQITTVALYAMQLVAPISELIMWMNEIQIGTTALSRIVGVQQVPPDRQTGSTEPADEHLVVDDVRYAYRPGHDVLHGIDLDLEVGERVAIVGPSGSGKSTLGRLLAGIHGPSSGSVTVGGVPLLELPVDDLRRHVALVTQEHHVFVGTLAENLRLAAPGATAGELEDSLQLVGALEWVRAMPAGLNTRVGSGAEWCSPRHRRSRLRSHAWFCSTRTPWCSTRRRRSSTPPRRVTWSRRCRDCSRVALWSRSPTDCTRRTTRTGWRCSRRGGSWNSDRTMSWSPRAGSMPHSGRPGTPKGADTTSPLPVGGLSHRSFPASTGCRKNSGGLAWSHAEEHPDGSACARAGGRDPGAQRGCARAHRDGDPVPGQEHAEGCGARAGSPAVAVRARHARLSRRDALRLPGGGRQPALPADAAVRHPPDRCPGSGHHPQPVAAAVRSAGERVLAGQQQHADAPGM
jgi:ABC-type multidrug transport system fused ATPase/permease subunit